MSVVVSQADRLLHAIEAAIIDDLKRVAPLSGSEIDVDYETGCVGFNGTFRPIEIARAVLEPIAAWNTRHRTEALSSRADWFEGDVDCDGNELVTIRADELQKLRDERDKFLWQVRDTCARAEALEAKLTSLREALESVDARVENIKGVFLVPNYDDKASGHIIEDELYAIGAVIQAAIVEGGDK